MSKTRALVVAPLCMILLHFGAAFTLPTETDWIIVGGGASGSAAAVALADAGENVLVIERGPSDLKLSSTQTAKKWAEVVASDAAEQIRWTDGPWGSVAKVLGGGASINDGYFFEETPEFMQELLQLSNDDLEAYFQSSRWLADELTTPLPPTDYGDAFAKAAELAGHGQVQVNDTGNIRYKDGAWVISSLFNLSCTGWDRKTPAHLLHERQSKSNLIVATDTRVKRITIENNRAVGVSVAYGWLGIMSKSITARKGVLMAAGAIYTPQLLQISGIGEKRLLDNLGVEQITELPVGRNFVDRLTWTVQILAEHSMWPLPKFLGYTVAANSSAGITFESVGGAGVDSHMAIGSLGLVEAKKRSAHLRPLMRALMATPIGSLVDQMSNIVALMHDPKSRGSVQATSRNSKDQPDVTANYFADESDLPKLVAILKEAIHIAEQMPLDKWRVSKALKQVSSMPTWVIQSLRMLGINVDSAGLPVFLSCLASAPIQDMTFISLPCLPGDKSQWGDFLRKNVLSTYHYFGTAAIGTVVEKDSFQVKGVQGLYVIDASVIPRATRINPVGTIMSLGHFVGKKLSQAFEV